MSDTARLDRLLRRLRGRVTRLVWVHGLSTVVGFVAAFLILAYALDWGLHMPRAVRWIQLLGFSGVVGFLVVRLLVRPLAARPDRVGCAVLLERAHPETRQLLVTAAELAERPGSVQVEGADTEERAAVRARIRADAETVASTIDPRPALDGSAPRLRLLAGSLAVVACGAVLVQSPGSAAIFLDRFFGGGTPWPQRTHLTIEVPMASAVPSPPPAAGEPLEVRIARGTDVPIVVRAEGAVPDEVTLHFSGGHRAVVAASGGPVFRTLLRAVQEDTSFHATGGDDEDEDPTVRLVVLRPPDVVDLAVRVEPPAYSGLLPETVRGGDAEVLAGSRLTVHVRTDPADATGRARLLPEDRVIDLEAAAFPAPAEVAADAPAEVPSPSGGGLAFALAPERSLRYRIELRDAAGLSNPDPGLFAVTVVEDRPPEVEILSPGRGDFDTVPGGSIALRARARDDFGIAAMTLTATPAALEKSVDVRSRELAWKPVDPSASADTEPGSAPERPPRGSVRPAAASTRVRAEGVARARLEVADLAGPEAASPGGTIELQVAAFDVREPTPHEGRSASVRVRIVTPDEFLRRLQDRLARVRTSAASLGELQRAKQRRSLELLATMESDALLSGEADQELFAAATGERRVEGDARALSRELCSALESVLYARVDERAAGLLDRADARLAESGLTFDPGVWRGLALEERTAAGQPSGLADRLLAIAGLALEISEVDAPEATRALMRAQDATDLVRVHAEISAAEASQKAVVAKVETLLELLAEWDNYQSVLSLTRDILSGQRNLAERTRTFAKEH